MEWMKIFCILLHLPPSTIILRFPWSSKPHGFSPTHLQFTAIRILHMGKPRTISQLIQVLPEEAQQADVYRGRTLVQLLEAGEVSCLAKLTNVACSSGDPKAAHWSMARKVHFALVAGGLDPESTGITPKHFTIRSSSPGARARGRARSQCARWSSSALVRTRWVLEGGTC